MGLDEERRVPWAMDEPHGEEQTVSTAWPRQHRYASGGHVLDSAC